MKPTVDPTRLRRDLRKASLALAVLSGCLVVAMIIALRTPSLAIMRNYIRLAMILFGLFPAVASGWLALTIQRQQFRTLVVALSIICSVYFLTLIAATFVATGIVADNVPPLAWRHVILMTLLSLPYAWTIYTLMRSYDSMKPDDWNVG